MEKKHHSFPKILLSLRHRHYQSYDEQLILDDLSRNKIDVVNTLLMGSYLINYKESIEGGKG